MADKPDISVIIVSRSRPDELRKVLACLRFQDISGFETVVVTNTPEAMRGAMHPNPLQLYDCDEANISVARNVGLQAAKGRYVAFCDDDALPDPSWLRVLLTPFENSDIGGCGGFTRGRNGISLQWGAVETDLCGVAHPLDIAPDSAPVIFPSAADSAPVMIGTNCAFRASALRQIGGFDPAFAYFLDDSDISLRLSQAGWHLAVVPQAQVHHGFAAGPYRAQNRVPKTLAPHGHSKACFCRKHAPETDLSPALKAFESLQANRLEKQMLAGLMEPPQLPHLLETLWAGYKSGLLAPLAVERAHPAPKEEAPPTYQRSPKRHVLLAGHKSDTGWLQSCASTLSKGGIIATTLALSRSPAYMQVSFSEGGYWQQSGGQFGKSDRDDPLLRWAGLQEKARAEVVRLARSRPVDYVVYPQKSEGNDIFWPQNDAMSCINGFVVESV